MGTFEVIEEITYALAVCTKYNNCCNCPHEDNCCNVFGKEYISEQIRELAEQCKAFNEFACANRKDFL